MEKQDVESQKREGIPHMKMILDQGVLTPDIANYPYKGAGTDEDPYVVTWIDHDPRNPFLWSELQKWTYAIAMAFATLAVSLCSSAYSGGIEGIIMEFHTSQEVVTLGLSLFVLGFALGPLIFAPMSELFGRQYLYFGTFAAFAVFNAGCAGVTNI
ncbi:hypothetical protein LTS18_010497, partial [Coniosporium uncinatum]